ncbi:hypothetical protein [Halostagnicola kamekurae]|uniref:Uncharacterized protein n=1 Tax=Halostagnicola kamekurae TaxID=619731 RepID=A0A1I6QS88_9EURY|nr:hypothetical protein [Halostagnicola kamekurae]SFS55274.1 hypothetical protein SAMN04488556_1502 [Halostagnicola kamekurae]
MNEDMLEDQARLVALLREEGWDVTDVELSAYDSPWEDSNDPEATITLTARKPYEDDAERDEEESDGTGDDNPFRIK